MRNPDRFNAALGTVLSLALLVAGQPVLAQTMHTLPFVTPASNTSQRSLVRIINRSDRAGTVTIHGIDDSGERFGPVSFSLRAKQTKHLDSRQLEGGATLSGGVGLGNGEGNWRLELETQLDIVPLAYIRGAQGFITTMHDVVRGEAMRHHVLTFNKAPVSLGWSRGQLRLINPSDDSVDVTITGHDDYGNPGAGAVSVTLPAGASRTLTAHQLEGGDDDFDGSLGDEGIGRWQLFVSADRPIRVMALMLSPNTGYMTNLSSMKGDDVIQGDAPDLVVESPSVSDSSLEAGASFTLSATVRNQGSDRSAATTLRYHRSSDATISSADTEVGTDDVSGLAASGTSDESIGVTAPSTAGTYYYGACVNSVSGESNTNNNCSSAVRVTVAGGPSGEYGAVAVDYGSACPHIDGAGLVVNRRTAQEALNAARLACVNDGGSASECRTRSVWFRNICVALHYCESAVLGCRASATTGPTLSAAESRPVDCPSVLYTHRIWTNTSGQRISGCSFGSNSGAGTETTGRTLFQIQSESLGAP